MLTTRCAGEHGGTEARQPLTRGWGARLLLWRRIFLQEDAEEAEAWPLFWKVNLCALEPEGGGGGRASVRAG